MSQFFSNLTLITLITCVSSLDNGLGIKPPMGWNAWYAFGCNITEQLVHEITEKFLALGLPKLGYEYINLDDCWAGGRYSNGTIYGQQPQFNASLKPLADYIHSKNLKFGVYTDRGTETCKQRPGSYGYEQQDATTYAEWGVDYLKEDSCYATGSPITAAFSEYAVMRDALNKTGRPIFFSLCHGRPEYGPIGMSLGNAWRIGTDDNSWINIFNHAAITPDQSRAQFSMWAVMSSPLMISSDIRNISQSTLETYTNQLVIDVNQDKLGKQGYRVQGENLALNPPNNSNGTNIWARELADGSRAFVFLNVGSKTVQMQCDATCFANAGFYNGVTVRIYDLWQNNQFIGNFSTSEPFIVEHVPTDEAAMFKMVPYYDNYPRSKREL